MKLAILTILICQAFTLKEDNQKKVNSVSPSGDSALRTNAESKDVIVLDSVYYSSLPIYYTYSPIVYYYWDLYYPAYWYVYRNEANGAIDKSKKEKKFNADEAKKEISTLKKEIWGNENFNTEEIKKNQKAYDPRWLMAQLKISRVLNLEDMIKNGESEAKNNLRTSTETTATTGQTNISKETNSAQITIDSKQKVEEKRTETHTETESETKKAKKASESNNKIPSVKGSSIPQKQSPAPKRKEENNVNVEELRTETEVKSEVKSEVSTETDSESNKNKNNAKNKSISEKNKKNTEVSNKNKSVKSNQSNEKAKREEVNDDKVEEIRSETEVETEVESEVSTETESEGNKNQKNNNKNKSKIQKSKKNTATSNKNKSVKSKKSNEKPRREEENNDNVEEIRSEN